MILAENMRRLVAWRIDHNRECGKQALHDLQQYGEQSRFVRAGDSAQLRQERWPTAMSATC